MWRRIGRAARDRSFIVGSILVVLFVLIAVLGPEVAPRNPFVRDRIQTVDGELRRAPIPPGAAYPLGTDDQGRDLLSLLLYGARQTLVIAFAATAARLLLGLMLGAFSGWWPGGVFDRAVTTVTESLAAVPGLILAILLVYAVGIQRGQISFVVALSLVGWGEVAQIVRGHVLAIRGRPYIEAARALGLSQPEILSRHVLPNLLATLLALAALEMGAVLLLLGELGFVYVFIGGGGRYRDDGLERVIHYFEVPDWGAMLGTSWRYFRVHPWLPIVPAAAFFVTILGFNLFGYGLQRFVERGRFHPSGWSVMRFFALATVLLLGAQLLLSSTGVEAQYAAIARRFDVQRAWNDVSYLTQPELEGRPTGPGGGFQAAAYIAQQFEQAGLTPLRTGGYYQSYMAAVPRVIAAPALRVVGEDLEIALGQGLAFNPYRAFESTDTRTAELVLVGNRHGSGSIVFAHDWIYLLLDAQEGLPNHWYRPLPYTGVLRMVPDELLGMGDQPAEYGGTYYTVPYPDLFVGESVVARLASLVGLEMDDIVARLAAGEELVLPTGLQVEIEAGVVYEPVPAANVIGYFPAGDVRSEGQRILVVAEYTGSALRDEVYPGADENASGVAVLLEIARLWREEGFVPKQTVVFAVLDTGGATQLAHTPIIPGRSGDTWTVVALDGLGAGEERLARLGTTGELARILDQSARRMGVGVQRLDRWLFHFVTYNPGGGAAGRVDPSYAGIAIVRPGDDLSGTPGDTLDHLDPRLLSEAGRTIAHFLMVLSSR